MNFLILQKKAEKLTSSKVKKDVWELIKTVENELAQYNRSQLYIDSKDVNKKDIGFYSTATELITKGKKKANTPFNLFDKGDFLPSIFSKVQKESIFFGATDKKLPKILKNLLTDDIFGLTEENLNKVINERFLPLILNYFNNALLN